MRAAARRIVMASKGHTTAHWLQPGQPTGPWTTAAFPQPRRSSQIARGGQAATQRPQPVQRAEISGKSRRRVGLVICGLLWTERTAVVLPQMMLRGLGLLLLYCL